MTTFLIGLGWTMLISVAVCGSLIVCAIVADRLHRRREIKDLERAFNE